MKHDWKPDGMYNHKYYEAYCTKCDEQAVSGADFMDTEKLDKWWAELEQRNDCAGVKRCPWDFASRACGYVGQLQNCNKTLRNCRGLNNSERFGGFPGIGVENENSTRN